ncbi:MAG: ROK family protein [Phycisphaerae bacterium]|nr:ROK family protein [Phycisphaerae bacterium]
MSDASVLLIGVDGGATEVKAHAAQCQDLARAASFTLRPETAARFYRHVRGFEPVPIAEQLTQRSEDTVKLTDDEVSQGQLWIQAAAEAIIDVARQCGARRVAIGEGMPGLKTADQRGIDAMNNGPRMPDYLDMLEDTLREGGLELVAPIAALGSDADYCGLGEEYAGSGLFRDVLSAYYVGCGTGIADAMKLGGELVPFDLAKSWIQKSWQMPSTLGPTFEKLVSATSLNRVYAEMVAVTESNGSAKLTRVAAGDQCDRDVVRAAAARAEAAEEAARRRQQEVGDSQELDEEDNREAYPEVAAVRGDPVASCWLASAALIMAELIFERLWTVKNGRTDESQRGTAYMALNPEHPYRGTVLDRVIIGQRVGQIYADRQYRDVFSNRLDDCLATLLARSDDAELAEACLDADGRKLRPGFLCASQLRAAPALGAAVAAVRALRR